MATYVNDLRVKEIGTGESSGTWGTETNVNLELIGEALSFGTEAITTNADTHTSTVADGSTDPARSIYIKYTGTLDSACTITIAPNTISRLHFIENGTSGSQNIIISQGSGANVTIPPGDVKVVYLDGAGSGAAVVDAFASLSTVDLKVQDDLTVTDDVSIGGATTIGGVLDITDTTDSSDATGDTGALRTEGGASIAKKLYVGTDLDVDGTTNLDVVDIDGAVDMASTLLVGGTVLATAAAAVNSTSAGGFGFASNNTAFYSFGADASTAGSYSFQTLSNNAAINVTPLQISSTGIIINEASGDLDFRIESNGNAGMFFVDGGNDKIGIGTTSPVSEMHINSSQSDTTLTIESDISSSLFTSGIDLIRDSVAAGSRIESLRDASNGGVGLKFLTTANNAAEVNGTLTSRMVILETGEVGIGTDSPSAELHVSGDSIANTFKLIANTSVSGSDATIFRPADNTLAFSANGAERMRINSTGRMLGFTTTNLEPDSTPTDANCYVIGPGYMFLNRDDTATIKQVVFGKNGSEAGNITTTSQTFYNSASDYRLKENIKSLKNSLERVQQLNPVQFDWKESGQTSEGFIAHEVQEIFSDAVTGEKDGKDMQGVDYGRITPLLVKAIQEQQEQIEQLKTEIQTLKGE